MRTTNPMNQRPDETCRHLNEARYRDIKHLLHRQLQQQQPHQQLQNR